MKKTCILSLMVLLSGLIGCSSDSTESANLDMPEVLDDAYEAVYSVHKLGLKQDTSNCDGYRAYLLDIAARNIAEQHFSPHRNTTGWDRWYAYDSDIGMAENEAAPADPSDKGGAAGSETAGEFTTTNVQEEGVDELDTIKNDGKTMYILDNRYVYMDYYRPINQIRIISSWPAESMKDMAIIDFSDTNHSYREIQGMLLQNNRLLVFERVNSWGGYNSYHWNYTQAGTRIHVYDVSDPAQPKKMHEHQIEGGLADARMINGKVYFALNSSAMSYSIYNDNESIPGVPEVPSWKVPDDEETYHQEWELRCKQSHAYIAKYLPTIRQWLEQKYPNNDMMKWPQYSDGKTSRNAISCENIYIPQTKSADSGLLMVGELSGKDFETFKSSAIADYGWLVYASKDNFYIVNNNTNWAWYCDAKADKACRNYSQIHRFNLKNGVKYINSGEVEGLVMNSFWLSENDSHLRVASQDTYFNPSTGSNVSILALDGAEMKVTGKISGIGKNENIFAARMFGDKGYVVTYRQTDPLYTIDLSNPAKPEIKGELKINGYSSYIHPLGDKALLTIGRDADSNGNANGIHLQIFDVSDMANPVRRHQVKLTNDNQNNSYSDSRALWDHHAFTYHAGSQLLAVPIHMYHWSYYNNQSISGLAIYKASLETGFKQVGFVNHGDMISDKNSWYTSMNRSRFMFKDQGVYDKNAYVYSISDVGVKVNDANKPETEIAKIQY